LLVVLLWRAEIDEPNFTAFLRDSWPVVLSKQLGVAVEASFSQD
jgi:hypothetical protein